MRQEKEANSRCK